MSLKKGIYSPVISRIKSSKEPSAVAKKPQENEKQVIKLNNLRFAGYKKLENGGLELKCSIKKDGKKVSEVVRVGRHLDSSGQRQAAQHKCIQYISENFSDSFSSKKDVMLNLSNQIGKRAFMDCVQKNGNECIVTIEDNGCGFHQKDEHQISRPHFGIQAMRERAESIGGKLTIENKKQKGTRVVVCIELNHHKERQLASGARKLA